MLYEGINNTIRIRGKDKLIISLVNSDIGKDKPVKIFKELEDGTLIPVRITKLEVKEIKIVK